MTTWKWPLEFTDLTSCCQCSWVCSESTSGGRLTAVKHHERHTWHLAWRCTTPATIQLNFPIRRVPQCRSTHLGFSRFGPPSNPSCRLPDGCVDSRDHRELYAAYRTTLAYSVCTNGQYHIRGVEEMVPSLVSEELWSLEPGVSRRNGLGISRCKLEVGGMSSRTLQTLTFS